MLEYIRCAAIVLRRGLRPTDVTLALLAATQTSAHSPRLMLVCCFVVFHMLGYAFSIKALVLAAPPSTHTQTFFFLLFTSFVSLQMHTHHPKRHNAGKITPCPSTKCHPGPVFKQKHRRTECTYVAQERKLFVLL